MKNLCSSQGESMPEEYNPRSDFQVRIDLEEANRECKSLGGELESARTDVREHLERIALYEEKKSKLEEEKRKLRLMRNLVAVVALLGTVGLFVFLVLWMSSKTVPADLLSKLAATTDELNKKEEKVKAAEDELADARANHANTIEDLQKKNQTALDAVREQLATTKTSLVEEKKKSATLEGANEVFSLGFAKTTEPLLKSWSSELPLEFLLDFNIKTGVGYYLIIPGQREDKIAGIDALMARIRDFEVTYRAELVPPSQAIELYVYHEEEKKAEEFEATHIRGRFDHGSQQQLQTLGVVVQDDGMRYTIDNSGNVNNRILLNYYKFETKPELKPFGSYNGSIKESDFIEGGKFEGSFLVGLRYRPQTF